MRNMIKVFNVDRQIASMRKELDEKIEEVISSTSFIGGDRVAKLEQRVEAETGVAHCVSCANGTDALTIALLALGIGPKDEVITTAFSYIAATEAIVSVGATPVFVDILPTTYGMDLGELEERITKHTKAILAVSLFGIPEEYEMINRIAKNSGLFVIDDAAQAFGSTISDRAIGHHADITCTSFFPTKPLGCLGDGGAILTNQADLARSARLIANHGQAKKYYHDVVGRNSRLDAIQAAVLEVKMTRYREERARREEIAQTYDALLSDVVQTLKISDQVQSAYALYTIQCEFRDELKDHLERHGVQSNVYYPVPITNQLPYKQKKGFKNAVTASMTALSIPCDAYMTSGEVADVTSIVNSFQQY